MQLTRLKNRFHVLPIYLGYVWAIACSIPSRFLFGTITKFWKVNVIPIARFIYKNKKFLNKNSILYQKGFVKLDAGLPATFWNDLHAKYVSVMNDASLSTFTKNGKTKRIKDPVASLGQSLIAEIINSPAIKNVLHDYYRGDFEIKEVDAWRNHPAKPEEYVYSNYWHMDDYSYTSLRVYCYLTDHIAEDSGATRVMEVSHSKKAIRNFRFLHTSIDGVRSQHADLPYHYLRGSIGDVYIFSADRCMHAATTILNDRPRDMLGLIIDFK